MGAQLFFNIGYHNEKAILKIVQLDRQPPTRSPSQRRVASCRQRHEQITFVVTRTMLTDYMVKVTS